MTQSLHHNMFIDRTVPLGFTEVEFVNTNGDTFSGNAQKANSAAAFSTGVRPTLNTTVETTFCPGNNGTGEWETYIGGSSSGDAINGAWILRRHQSSPYLAFSVNYYDTSHTRFARFVNEQSWVWVLIKPSRIRFAVDGDVFPDALTVPGVTSLSSSYPIWIGASGRGQSHDSYRGCKALFKRTRIFEGDRLIRDYVPVRRDSDGVCGFYDRINYEFKISEVPNHSFTATGY